MSAADRKLDPAYQMAIEITTLGEVLIDLIPGEAGLPLGDVPAFYPKPGGAPANVAAAASRLGAASAFIGKVGEDHFGQHLARVLAEEGVDLRGLRYDPEARTTLAFIALPAPENPEFVFYRNPGADQRLDSGDLDRALLESTRMLHCGSVSLSAEPARSATREAVRIARSAGALISCDVNFRPALWEDPAQALVELESLLPEVDLVKVNEAEASLLTGVAGLGPAQEGLLEGAARKLLERGPALAVITLGAAGSYFLSRAGGGFVPGFKVRSVDAVGCGDAFQAGLLVGILQEERELVELGTGALHKIVIYANAVGALTSLAPGAIPALPTAREVSQFLADRRAG